MELSDNGKRALNVEIDKQKVDELLGLCRDMIKDTKGVVQD